MEFLFFYLVALFAVISGFLVISCKNPVNSAISLVMTFVCLATFYVMLKAPFMAAIQIMVYAGAIMVLIIFVIMLLNVKAETSKRSSHAVIAGSIVGLFTLFLTGWFLIKGSLTGMTGTMDKAQIVSVGHTELIGTALFTDFLLPFEITSLLLLSAIVGAVILAKKKI
jgi:NADH-quinone oxidoreductase subunit J